MTRHVPARSAQLSRCEVERGRRGSTRTSAHGGCLGSRTSRLRAETSRRRRRCTTEGSPSGTTRTHRPRPRSSRAATAARRQGAGRARPARPGGWRGALHGSMRNALSERDGERDRERRTRAADNDARVGLERPKSAVDAGHPERHVDVERLDLCQGLLPVLLVGVPPKVKRPQGREILRKTQCSESVQ